jgi:hypothetical protein
LDVSSDRESIRENMKTLMKENLGYHRLKHNKMWLDDECSKLIEQWSKQITMVAKSKPNQWR